MCDNSYYVEGLNYNLLSVSQLNSSGCKVEFENKIAKIYVTNGKLIRKGDKNRGNLFYLDMNDATCLVEFLMCGYGTRGYVMLTLITWAVLVT